MQRTLSELERQFGSEVTASIVSAYEAASGELAQNGEEAFRHERRLALVSAILAAVRQGLRDAEQLKLQALAAGEPIQPKGH